MTVQQLAPGTPIEVAHAISPPLDGGPIRWGFSEECGSKHHKHTSTAYVTRHYPGMQVCYSEGPRRREHAVEDHPGMYRVDTSRDWRDLDEWARELDAIDERFRRG